MTEQQVNEQIVGIKLGDLVRIQQILLGALEREDSRPQKMPTHKIVGEEEVLLTTEEKMTYFKSIQGFRFSTQEGLAMQVAVQKLSTAVLDAADRGDILLPENPSNNVE